LLQKAWIIPVGFPLALRTDDVRFGFGDYLIDAERRELRRADQLVELEPQVFDILLHLIRNGERVVSKDELIAAIWGGRIVSHATIDSRVKAARRAVGDTGAAQTLIRTFPRKGLRFIAEFEEIADAKSSRASPASASSAGLPLPDKPSIAVLPFTNMSGDTEQEYFADGMTEDVITALSKWRWFFVIARNSTFAYKGRSIDITQVGRELGVQYVLEGSVRRAGERIRVTAQLIDARSGAHAWAERYDQSLVDIFALQDEITRGIAAAIEPVLARSEAQHATTSRPKTSRRGIVTCAVCGISTS
jgi:TolB-like protein